MRILIATATAGGGHLAAAAALEESWHALRPDDEIKTVDLVDFFSPIHRKIHADGYVKLVEHAPEIWGMVFGKTDNPQVARRLHDFKRVFPSKSRSKFTGFVNDFAPQLNEFVRGHRRWNWGTAGRCFQNKSYVIQF